MYERSAIVLERYFESLLEYREDCNIRDNFNNYCDLVDKLEKYQVNYEKELVATEEFNKSMKAVKDIQASQEKLYKKIIKLEFNRNLLFNNIEGKIEDTRKGIEKIESDVNKNNEAMKEAKEKLLDSLTEYSDRRFELNKCKKQKRVAENAYNQALEIAKSNFEGITSEIIEIAKEFVGFENAEDIINCLEKNGKGEKIPFNGNVMKNATLYGIDLAKKEVASYLVIYEKMSKLLSDIEEGTTKIELYKKYLKNEKAKIDFIVAAKNYIVQFLDYERMAIIHGQKNHDKLMSNACEKFTADIVQINNLFELIVKETSNKATKKAYKELYNNSYLVDIQKDEESFKREKNRINIDVVTLINSNYWRVEGITEVYTIFYNTVTELFGRDVADFEVPKAEPEVDIIEDDDEIVENNITEIKIKSKKMPFEIKSNSSTKKSKVNQEDEDWNIENIDIIDNDTEIVDFNKEPEEEFDIFGEKYQNIDFLENEVKSKNLIEEIEKLDEIDNTKPKDDNKVKFKGKKTSKAKKIEKIEEDIPYEVEDEEESLLLEVKPIKKKNEIEDIEITEEPENIRPSVIFKKMKKVNNARKKGAESIW